MQNDSSPKTAQSSIHGTTAGISAQGDAIDMLLQDHTRIKALLETLTTSQDPQTQIQTVEELKQLLTIHNATEENFVYPALANEAGHKRTSEHLYHETAMADMMLFEVDTCLKTGDVDGFAENAEKLRDAVLEHIDDEEQKAFPKLREDASEEAMQLLNRGVSRFRSSLKFTNA